MTLPAILIAMAIWWWLVFFMLLPWRIEDNAPKPSHVGHSTGAPAKPLLRKKVAITTLVAMFLTLLTYIAAINNVHSFWDEAREESLLDNSATPMP
jgi:predicted secreted protein